jgi:hypothetical protein
MNCHKIKLYFKYNLQLIDILVNRTKKGLMPHHFGEMFKNVELKGIFPAYR